MIPAYFACRAMGASYMRFAWRATERSRAANFCGRAQQVDSPSSGLWKLNMANPFEFIQQVRAEASKVIWPTRRETLVTTGMVLLMAVFASVFFVVVDEILRIGVGFVLGIGRH
jgi:preprotein translocase subunit SecE